MELDDRCETEDGAAGPASDPVLAGSTYAARHIYNDAKVADYRRRKAGKHRAEIALVRRALDHLAPGAEVLDLPCGFGRMSVLMAGRGFAVTAADLSSSMRAAAVEHTAACGFAAVPVEAGDAEALGYRDRRFDATLCFRLFQHFPTAEVRGRAVGELCRVSSRHVLVSYFSDRSATALKRRWQVWRRGGPPSKYHNSLREVAGYFAAAGFRLEQNYAQFPLWHALHIAVFRRA